MAKIDDAFVYAYEIADGWIKLDGETGLDKNTVLYAWCSNDVMTEVEPLGSTGELTSSMTLNVSNIQYATMTNDDVSIHVEGYGVGIDVERNDPASAWNEYVLASGMGG